MTTDKSGHFSIRGVVPGDYKLLAWEDPEFLKEFEDRSTAISIKPNSVESRNLPVISAAIGQ
jgi:hypothetical protein